MKAYYVVTYVCPLGGIVTCAAPDCALKVTHVRFTVRQQGITMKESWYVCDEHRGYVA